MKSLVSVTEVEESKDSTSIDCTCFVCSQVWIQENGAVALLARSGCLGRNWEVMARGGSLPTVSHTSLAAVCRSGFCTLLWWWPREEARTSAVSVVLWEAGMSGVLCTCR